MQCCVHCLLYPAETSNVTANCNYWRPYHEACVLWANVMLTRSMPYTCTRIQTELKSIECHSTLQSTLSRHQSNRAWRCRGSLAIGTRNLSPAASRRFPMVLGDTASATCAQISSLDAVRAATAARTVRRTWRQSELYGRAEPGLWVWECFTDHC